MRPQTIGTFLMVFGLPSLSIASATGYGEQNAEALGGAIMESLGINAAIDAVFGVPEESVDNDAIGNAISEDSPASESDSGDSGESDGDD